MSRIAGMFLLVGGMVLIWQAVQAMHPEAVAMALGMLFGMLAGVPTALLVLTGGRHRQPEGKRDELPDWQEVDDTGPAVQRPGRAWVIDGEWTRGERG